jgi:hypothetical protein
MALQSFTLSRAAEAQVATAKLVEITPKNWRRYPSVAGSTTPVAIPTITYTGGATGDDVDTATANSTTPYTGLPRTQAEKASLTGNTLAVDVARPRGFIAPNQSYLAAGGTAPAAPVVSSIAPTTGTAATLPLTVTITGTGFTPYSTVRTGGSATPDASGKYVSATQMKVAIFAAAPGAVSVAVEDHDLLSNVNVVFTVT